MKHNHVNKDPVKQSNLKSLWRGFKSRDSPDQINRMWETARRGWKCEVNFSNFSFDTLQTEFQRTL